MVIPRRTSSRMIRCHVVLKSGPFSFLAAIFFCTLLSLSLSLLAAVALLSLDFLGSAASDTRVYRWSEHQYASEIRWERSTHRVRGDDLQ